MTPPPAGKGARYAYRVVPSEKGFRVLRSVPGGAEEPLTVGRSSRPQDFRDEGHARSAARDQVRSDLAAARRLRLVTEWREITDGSGDFEVTCFFP